MNVKAEMVKVKIPIRRDLLICLALIILSDINFYFHTSASSGVYLVFFLLSSFIIIIDIYNYLKLDAFIIIILLLEVIQFFFTFVNGSINYAYLVSVIGEILLIFYLNVGLKRNPFETIRLFRIALLVLFFLDVLSILFCLFIGNYTNSVFGLAGHKNYHSFLFLAVMAIHILYRNMQGKYRMHVSTIILFGTCIICEILLSSASGIFVIFLFSFACIFLKNWKVHFFDLRIVTVLLLFINYIIIFLNKTTWLSGILKLLGRDTSFTGRNVIWEPAIQIIKENLFWGQGYVRQIQFYNAGVQDNHCHNFF